jgi:Mn2+/Fe2+ NRAMP family transporter
MKLAAPFEFIMPRKSLAKNLFSIFGLGMIVAATGVGAGDLAVSAMKGHDHGAAILWAVLLGCLFKFLVSEGIARYQLATGETLLEGIVLRLAPAFRIVILIYLPIWTALVAIMLMSAAGIATNSILPLDGWKIESAKTAYGAIHSLVAVAIIWKGGFKWFERLMAICVALMTAGVLYSAIKLSLAPVDLTEAAPEFTLPTARSVVELIGGVGGTVTLLSYSYWLREAGRGGREDLQTCRLDLFTGYLMTALFAGSMVVIGSQVAFKADASNTRILLNMAAALEGEIGPTGRWIFLLGAWAAIASSVLGVWQGTPYLFADLMALAKERKSGVKHEPVASTGKLYRAYLLAMATLPIAGVYLLPFATIAKLYAITGALVVPALAIIMLRLNGQSKIVGDFRNRPLTTITLIAVIGFFVATGGIELYENLKALLMK